MVHSCMIFVSSELSFFICDKYQIVNNKIAVCTYRLVMISIDLSETGQRKRTGNPRQNSVNSVQDKIREFFSNKSFPQ